MFTDSEGLSNSLPEIANSLRFNASASTYASRTFALGDRQKWTYSVWFKNSTNGADARLFNADTSGTSNGMIRVVNDVVFIEDYNNTYNVSLVSTLVLRDPSAWYHLVVTSDTTQATASNRVKVYLNGVQITSFTTAIYPAQNFNWTCFNNATSHVISKVPYHNSGYFDGYLANKCWIDGQTLTPSSFAYTDTNGQWRTLSKAALTTLASSGGTNSFFLPFDNTTSTTTLGYDASSKGNNWTLTNMVRDGSVNDCSSLDTPTNNFATLNPLFAPQSSVSSGVSGSVTETNGNLTVASNAGSVQTSAIGTIGFTTGKWYCEYVATAVNSTYDLFGFINTFDGGNKFNGYRSNGTMYNQGATTSGFATWTVGDVIGLALDCDAGTLACYKNNTLISTITISGGVSAPMFPIVWFRDASGSGNINFGQRPVASGSFDSASGGYFRYTPPTGYKALCRKNLPDPAITFPNKHFDVLLHNGNSSTQTITGLAFQPDLLWGKLRNTGYNHILTDAVRGVTKVLNSDTTSAEQTLTDTVSSFNANGFSVGSNTYLNGSGYSYVDWLFNMGGSTVTNTNGTITSQVRANALAGMSVVTWTGNGSTGTIGHGLSSAPKLIITKYRGVVNAWQCYHSALGAGYKLYLNQTDAQVASSTVWNNTSPTSSVFSVGDANTNGSGGTYVAYCFTEIPGFSKIGSYTGNGSSDGPMVVCGFKPRYVMVKRTDSAASWYIRDTARDSYNQALHELYADLSNAEATNTAGIDILSNGFKLRNSFTDQNASGGTYVYLAIAETPFKFSNAR